MSVFGEWNFKIKNIQAGTWLLLIHPSLPESKNTGSKRYYKCAVHQSGKDIEYFKSYSQGLWLTRKCIH